jgi:hypothetical protein
MLPAGLIGAAAADDDELLLLVNAEKMPLLLDADAEEWLMLPEGLIGESDAAAAADNVIDELLLVNAERMPLLLSDADAGAKPVLLVPGGLLVFAVVMVETGTVAGCFEGRPRLRGGG